MIETKCSYCKYYKYCGIDSYSGEEIYECVCDPNNPYCTFMEKKHDFIEKKMKEKECETVFCENYDIKEMHHIEINYDGELSDINFS